MVFAAVGAVWLVLIIAGGSLLGLCIRSAGGRDGAADELSPPLYVADILAHRSAPPVDGVLTVPGELPSP